MTTKNADRDWFVAVQVNATSLIDEGVERVLDLFQEAAAANVVMLSVHGFNPEVIDRPATYSGHGAKGPHRSAGGTFTIPDPEHYRGLPLGDARVKEPFFQGVPKQLALCSASISKGWIGQIEASQPGTIRLVKPTLDKPESDRETRGQHNSPGGDFFPAQPSSFRQFAIVESDIPRPRLGVIADHERRRERPRL